MNSVNLIGNIGTDIELKYSGNGKAISKFNLAVQDDYNREKTHWVSVTCFGKTAEITSEYLRKGSKCGIIGKLNFEQWEQEGQKRSKLTVIADRIEFLDSKSDKQTSKPPVQKPREHQDDTEDD